MLLYLSFSMHHSPKTTSRSTSPHLQHRIQPHSLMDDLGNGTGAGVGGGGGASTITGHLSSLYPPAMSTMNQQTSTTSSLIDSQYHNQYQQTGGSLLDHPLTPTKFRQMTSTSSQTGQNGHHHYNTGVYCTGSGGVGAKSCSTSTLAHQASAAQVSQSSQASGGSYHLYRQQSSCSANFSPLPLHAHQVHASTTTSDLGLGNSHNPNVIMSTTTVNSVATASTLADSCCSGTIQIHQGMGAGAACQSSELLHQHRPTTSAAATAAASASGASTSAAAAAEAAAASAGGCVGMGMAVGGATPPPPPPPACDILPVCQREGGPHCCSGRGTVRQRWHTCPELHKAMDGVTYIADQTRKEEESTRVSETNSVTETIIKGLRQADMYI